MTSTVKTCFKCGAEKAITEFYAHPQMADGRLNKCKECTKKDVSENYRSNIGYYKEYERGRNKLPHRVEAVKRYAKTPAGKAAHARALKNQRDRAPEKYRARLATGNAIRDGRLIPQPCEVCGQAKVDAHHDDYSKPLDVRWLCRKHHTEHHRLARQEAA